MQLQLYFGFQAAQFPTETSKTLYAASYLRGQAAEWFAGYLKDYLDNMHTPNKMGDEAKVIFESFDNFRRAIVRIYGDPDQYKKAAINIQRLQQTGSVQEYTSKFYTMSAKTEWDDDALSAIYYKGLKDPIKDELSREDITKDMDEIVEKAIRIDNRLQERRAEKRSNNFTWAPSRRAQGQRTTYPSNYYGPRPMEIDVAQRQDKRKSAKKTRPQTKYSKTDSKCYNCGKKGHFKRECRSPSKEYEKKRDKRPPTAKRTIQVISKGKEPVSPDA